MNEQPKNNKLIELEVSIALQRNLVMGLKDIIETSKKRLAIEEQRLGDLYMEQSNTSKKEEK